LKRFMEPLWGRNKKYIASTVRKYTKLFASLKYLKIKMDFEDGDVDTIGELIPWVLNLKRTKCFFFIIDN